MVNTNSQSSYYEKFTATGEVKCIDDEIPFDLPDGWEWCRFNSLYWLLTDGAHNTPKYTTSGVPFLSVKDMSSGKLSFNNTKFISEAEHKLLSQRCNPQKGDLLISKVGTTGIPLIIDTEKQFSIFVSLALIKFFNSLIDSEFLVNIINSPFVQEQVKANTRGVGNKNWVLTAISRTLFVIPPIVEQRRIVAALRNLSPILERYEKSQNTLNLLNENINTILKKSILQEAIQGRLVAQCENDEPAPVLLEKIRIEKQRLMKEGKLKRTALVDSVIVKGDDNKYYENLNGEVIDITDQIPFDIPSSWQWIRLGQIGDWGAGATPARGTLAYYQNGTIPWLKTGELNNSIVYDSVEHITQKALQDCSLRLANIGDILIAMYGATIGKLAIAGAKLTTNQACCGCTPFKGVFNRYLFYYLMANKDTFIEMGAGGAQPNISREKIVRFLFALPPENEQYKIVSRIDTLFQLLN